MSKDIKFNFLNSDEEERYQKHFTLKEIGYEGQLYLKNSSVLCIGAGGLGSSVLLYLAAAGIGRIGIVDNDQVEKSNLQRQIIHETNTIGNLKIDSARERIKIKFLKLWWRRKISKTFDPKRDRLWGSTKY